MNNKLTLPALIGITLAFFATVRSVPSLAAEGWSQILYMFIAGGLFALPIALVSAELSTIWTDSGGPQVWVQNALGEAWGFVVSWLLWIQMFFGMVMVASVFSVMLGDVLEIEALEKNNKLIFLVIVLLYWLVTILNLKYDMMKMNGGWGAIVGVYLPFVVIAVLGIIYFARHGINPEGYLANFSAGKLLPDFSHLGKLPIFVGIVFIFAGVEMSSVHVNEIKNPGRNYPIAVIAAVVLVVVFNLVAGLGVANAVPEGQIQLSNVVQAITIFTKDLGIPHIFNNLLALAILVGIFVSLSAWVLGPSKAMQHVAEEGALPPFFQKRNAKGDPVTLVLIQASVVTLIATVFLLPGDTDTIFLVITVTTTLIYCVVYLLILISAMRLRITKPDANRIFRLGGKTGNDVMFVLAGIAILITLVVMFICFIPPETLPSSEKPAYFFVQIAALVAAVGSGLLIYRLRKPEWKIANNAESAENTEN